MPKDCSVVGFDDVVTSALYTPSLTTIRQPMEAMGQLRSALLAEGSMRCWKTSRQRDHRKMAPELVVRESTRSLL